MTKAINLSTLRYAASHHKPDKPISELNLLTIATQVYRRMLSLGKRAVPVATEGVPYPAQYLQYLQLVEAYKACNDDALWLPSDASEDLRNCLESLRGNRQVVRLVYGHPVTGEDYLQEFAVTGLVRPSAGVFKTPMLHPVGFSYGAAIDCESLMRVVDVQTGAILYQSPLYVEPELYLSAPSAKLKDMGYACAVRKKGQKKAVAHFKSREHGQTFIEFALCRINKL